MSCMARHSDESNFALFARGRTELLPFLALEAFNIVDRVIEIDVDVVGLQAAQTSLERSHERIARSRWIGDDLRSQINLVALAFERTANRRLRLPIRVVLGAVEVVDPCIVCVKNEGFLARV